MRLSLSLLVVYFLYTWAPGLYTRGPGSVRPAWADAPPEAQFPVNLVNGRDAQRVREVLGDYSIHRDHRSHFESTPKVYRYLLDRLPLAATLIRLLDLGKYKITENADGALTVDNQEGLVLKVWMSHKSGDQVVAYMEGVYRSWWTSGIHGRAAVWLRFHPKELEGRSVMENQFLGFIKFTNPVVEIVAKVVNFVLRRLTDTEIERSQSAGRSLAELLAKRPAKVYAAMRKSEEVSPGALEEFRTLFLGPQVSAAVPSRDLAGLWTGRPGRMTARSRLWSGRTAVFKEAPLGSAFVPA